MLNQHPKNFINKLSQFGNFCLYPSASILPENRVVFNIKGNHYRLIVKISYDYQMIWIRFIGTHAEYDKINATKI